MPQINVSMFYYTISSSSNVFILPEVNLNTDRYPINKTKYLVKSQIYIPAH